MTVTSIAHVSVRTTDLQKTLDFYTKGLGMKKQFDFIKNGKLEGYYVKADNNTFIEVFYEPTVVPIKEYLAAGNGTITHYCFQTESVKELRQQLLDHGYAARELSMGRDGAPQFWVTDPNGLEIEFQEYAPNCAQLTGETVDRS